MDSTRFDVLGIGGCAWDLLGRVAHYPRPGQKTGITDYQEQGGGQAATAMVAVARLGGRAAICGTVGEDRYGDAIRADFHREGVDTSRLILDPGQTSHFAFCAVQEGSGERAIFYFGGSKRPLQPSDVDAEYVQSARCLLVDTHHPETHIAAAKLAREAGLPVVTDIEHPVEGLEELLRLGTHHILPEHFLLDYLGEKDGEKAATIFRERWAPPVLVVTRGAEGCVAYEGDQVLRQPAYPVDPVVDTTGAGDVFHGAFAYGLVLGYDLATNLEFAALVAGLKCRRLGGRAGIPTREEMKELWRLPLP